MRERLTSSEWEGSFGRPDRATERVDLSIVLRSQNAGAHGEVSKVIA